MKYIFLVLFCCNFFNLYSQNDTEKKYFFSGNINLQYKYIIGDSYFPSYYFSPLYGDVSHWSPDRTYHSLFSYNGKIFFNCKIHNKIYFKTGLEYFNKRSIITSNYDTITKYSEPQFLNTRVLKSVYNSNSIEIPVIINYISNKIIIGAGFNFGFFDFNYNYFELYDQSKRTEMKNTFVWTNYKKAGEFPLSFVCSFDYLLFNKKIPIYLSSNIKKYLDRKEIYFGLGLNMILSKSIKN